MLPEDYQDSQHLQMQLLDRIYIHEEMTTISYLTRAKRKEAIGIQNVGTTYHGVRVSAYENYKDG